MSDANERLKVAMEHHKPIRESSPFSLVDWQYCSCGSYEPFMASDGYVSVGPARYPCKTLRTLRGDGDE